jgi:calcineurin-like phosphoesterase family protein
MSNIFLCSDHHYNHSNILTFTNADGSRVRDFASVEEMNDAIISRHNSVVRPNDKVYFLGDLAMGKSAHSLKFLDDMNGEKILIKGNHDLCSAFQYFNYFKDVRGSHQLAGLIFTHIPIHPDSLSRWTANVHGHLHTNQVMLNNKPDPRYLNVSLEQINFTPISLEKVLQLVKHRLEASVKF